MGKNVLGDERIEHPSFAIVNINRVQIGGGHKNLFDSPFKHHHTITLEISPACLDRSHHADRVMHSGTVPYIRVAMSEVQFSELILNAGRYGGTPCTVEFLNGESVPEPPERDLKKLWANEVKEGFKTMADTATAADKAVEDLLEKDRISKGDLRSVKNLLYKLAQDLRTNVPWMQERFQEAMEKTVADAKGEINAHFTNVVQKTGLSALQAGDPPIGLGMDPSAGKEKTKP